MTVIRSRIHQLGRLAPVGGWERGDGIPINFVERSRRESRTSSRDFNGNLQFKCSPQVFQKTLNDDHDLETISNRDCVLNSYV